MRVVECRFTSTWLYNQKNVVSGGLRFRIVLRFYIGEHGEYCYQIEAKRGLSPGIKKTRWRKCLAGFLLEILESTTTAFDLVATYFKSI